MKPSKKYYKSFGGVALVMRHAHDPRDNRVLEQKLINFSNLSLIYDKDSERINRRFVPSTADEGRGAPVYARPQIRRGRPPSGNPQRPTRSFSALEQELSL